MPTREEVYQAIDGERAYQDSMVTPGFEEKIEPFDPEAQRIGTPYTEVEEAMMLLSYAGALPDLYTKNAGSGLLLHQMRKIAAICVRCMESHGAPRRPRST